MSNPEAGIYVSFLPGSKERNTMTGAVEIEAEIVVGRIESYLVFGGRSASEKRKLLKKILTVRHSLRL